MTLEPSNSMPSSNVSSLRASAGIEKCCQTPGKSMNRRSTVVTSRCRICAKTSLGVTQTLSFCLNSWAIAFIQPGLIAINDRITTPIQVGP